MPDITMSQKIKALLEATKTTSKELAEFVDVSQSTVSCWVARGATPSMEHLPAIAEFFGITLVDLYKEHPEEYIEKKRIAIRESNTEAENLYLSAYKKKFSAAFKKSLHKISEDSKLIQDTEELISLFQNLDAWHRHIVLAHAYEQVSNQQHSEKHPFP